MKLSEMMKEKQLLSFELFPPKTDKGMANLPGTIEKLCEFKPEYISCTMALVEQMLERTWTSVK